MENGYQRVSAGRIRMQITSFLATERGKVNAINSDTDICPEDVPIIVDHVARIYNVDLPPVPRKPRHGWKVSTLVGFIHDGQRPRASSGGTP